MKYMLVQDNDSHWYVIPAQHKIAWDAFCEIDSDDPAAWTPPAWAQQVGGSYTLVTFENPVIA